MKITGIAFALLIAQVSFSQDCTTQAANKPSVLTRSQDNYQDRGSSNTVKPRALDITRMKVNLGKAESWIKNKLTGFTGAKLDYHNEYSVDALDFVAYKNDDGNHSYASNFYNTTGIKGYCYNKLMFFAYYCYDNKLPLHTEGESGSSVKVVFNNVFESGLCSDVGIFTVNGKIVFKKFEKTSSEGRVDFYDLRAKHNNDAIYTSYMDIYIIRNSDKPVFIPVTRKEYLEQMLKDIPVYKTKKKDFLNTFFTTQVRDFEKEMSVYKASDRSYTPEKEEKRRRWFKEDVNPEKLAKDLKKLDDEVTAVNQLITQYLGKPQEWLSRGFSTFYNGSFETYYAPALQEYLDKLDVFAESREDLTRTEVVSLNPAYYNKEISRDVPQLILVALAKGRYPHMLKVADLMKQPGALAPLEAILNPGKAASPDIVLPEATSAYTLKYLPKLTKLTPLTVPAGVQFSAVPFANDYTSNVPAAKLNVELPARSPKLSQLQQLLTTESYKTYIQQLYAGISTNIKPGEKTKADDYIKRKNLTRSKDISNTAFAAWLQNAPAASLYLYSKAVITNPSDALAANNFSAFLMMGGLPEKSIPILEYWNKLKPGEATLLGNLGNAYYRLGDMDKAMNYLQQCVQRDTLNPVANKILCVMYLKKGDTKKAEEHGTKSITTSYDEQVVTILRQLNNKVKPGEIMSRLQDKEFPLLKRITLPALPSELDEMEKFVIDLEAEKNSLRNTIENIEAKMPAAGVDVLQKQMMTRGIPALRVKAQYIITDGMQTYQRESVRESDVFKFNLKKLAAPYTANCKAISKKYADKLNKLEGGEAGDEDQIAALELVRCKEINAESAKYLAVLSPLVNQYAQRQEYIARKFYRDYANWIPFWMPDASNSFPSIERDYLKAVAGILSEYTIVNKSNCSVFEPLEKKEGVLKKWEDAYCANVKRKIGFGPVAATATCTSWGIEGGEGIVGELEVNFAEDGSFEDVVIGAGLGESWNLGGSGIAQIEAGASVKEFLRIGRDKTTGEWGIKDVGVKTEVALEANIGKVATEVKIIEVSIAVNAGLEVGGGVPAVIKNLK